MDNARFIVGIDLGTTNSAMACVDLSREPLVVELVAVPQVVAPGVVESHSSLPSALYLAAPDEVAPGALDLPWGAQSESAVGEWARSRGAEVPMRLVSSAKSWLCHAGVDRTSPILPWQAPDEIPKVSPVDASSLYLAHLRAAWDHAHPGHPLEQQDVLLTVPASFDAVARELTTQAAMVAGFGQVTLLEEPQAAFYSWLAARGETWRRELELGDVVLVCDIGGGTSDFSLIAVSAQDGNLTLERVAVGEHILLGGDNMDLALAQLARGRLEEQSGAQLDAWQHSSLVHACRAAKEQILAGARDSAAVVIQGRGSKLVGGSLRTELSRLDVEQLLVDGFFPRCPADDRPGKQRRTGLREIGLPYASEPAITRHLARFIKSQRAPTALLCNGGVMKAEPLRRRLVETLSDWTGQPPKLLDGTDSDLAVAHGAAYYGLARRGRGVRIRGGTARSYYVGIESSAPAVPGFQPPLKALCVAPFGMEEGEGAEVADCELGLVVGEPAEFRFLSSTTRRDDRVGTMIDDAAKAELGELVPVSIELDGRADEVGQLVPVKLRSQVTEIGTLELWCVAADGRRWKLEYNVRESD